MTIHTFPQSIGVIAAFANRGIASVARRIARLNADIDARAPITRHRMGAWETSTSPAGQHAMRVLRVNAEKIVRGESNDTHERVSGMLSENG